MCSLFFWLATPPFSVSARSSIVGHLRRPTFLQQPLWACWSLHQHRPFFTTFSPLSASLGVTVPSRASLSRRASLRLALGRSFSVTASSAAFSKSPALIFLRRRLQRRPFFFSFWSHLQRQPAATCSEDDASPPKHGIICAISLFLTLGASKAEVAAVLATVTSCLRLRHLTSRLGQ